MIVKLKEKQEQLGEPLTIAMREMDYPTKFKNILSYGIIFIASDWKQSKFSSLADWLNKLWYVYHLEYYSVMRKNGEDIYAMRSDFQNIKAK